MFAATPSFKSLFVQPSLWAHYVLTIKGPSMVVGWEAGCLADKERFAKVSMHFAFGLGTQEMNIVRNLSLEQQQKNIPQHPGDSGQH